MSTEDIAVLVEKANRQGVTLLVDNHSLCLKVLKGNKVDLSLMEVLKNNKLNLINYLNNQNNWTTALLEERKDIVELEKGLYYKINAHHPSSWWLNQSVDVEFKKKLYKIVAFHISGNFNLTACKSAVRSLYQRHEILRTSFHHINGEDYMRVELPDNVIYSLYFSDLRSITAEGDNLLGALMNFDDVEFDLFAGPLFKVRLLQTADEEYVLSMIIHHSIYDGWSMEVLCRDFMSLYNSIESDTPCTLPDLKIQYKDYGYLNTCYQQANRDSHSQYWNNFNVKPPQSLYLPIEKSYKPHYGQECQTEFFFIPKAIKNRITLLARRHNTSMFITLQALFSSFIFNLTGQTDIIIGLIRFNRSAGGDIEQQIGPYAKFYLLRFLLADEDTFAGIIEKVKNANNDSVQYDAYTQLDALSAMQQPASKLNGNLWKFNMYYEEQHGYGLNLPESTPRPRTLKINSMPVKNAAPLLNINIELKFINRDDTVDLVVSYQKDLYDAPGIKKLIGEYLGHLKMIAYNES